MSRHLLGLVVAGGILAVAAACGGDDEGTPNDGPPGAPTPAVPTDGGRDTGQPPRPDASDPDACAPNPDPPKKVFLNRGGGTYTNGQNDSRANTSPDDEQENVISPWEIADDDFAKLTKCLDAKFAPFNVEITDEDPGSEEHIEIVFANDDAHVFTVAPPGPVKYSPNCGVVPNMIAFVSQSFASAGSATFFRACGTIGQIVGRAYGAEIVVEEVDAGLCTDAMDSRILTCGDAPFTTTEQKCGTSATGPQDCVCNAGATTQASFSVIDAVAGPRCVR